ncbi:MAG: hypothetical protein ACD_47C00256G0005 [uncultured bacterium]|nr:MAG: hypothetical protein ACD_47C00256G0005 [uncultured bacterium]
MGFRDMIEYFKSFLYKEPEKPLPVNSKIELKKRASKILSGRPDAFIDDITGRIYSLKDVLVFDELVRLTELYKRIADSDGPLALKFIDSSRGIMILTGFEFLKKSAIICAQILKKIDMSTLSKDIVDIVAGVANISDIDGGVKVKILDLAGMLSTRGKYQQAMSLLENTPETVRVYLMHGDNAMAMEIFEFLTELAIGQPVIAGAVYEKSPVLLSLMGYSKIMEFTRFCVEISRGDLKDMVEILKNFTENFVGIRQYGQNAAADAFEYYARIARVSRKTADALIAAAFDITEKRGFEAFKKLALICQSLARKEDEAVKIIERFDEIVEQAGMDGFTIITDFCRRMALFEVEAAVAFIDKIPQLIKITDFNELADFIDFNTKMVEAHGKMAQNWFEGSIGSIEEFVSAKNFSLYKSMYKHCSGLTMIFGEDPGTVVGRCLELRSILSDKHFPGLFMMLSNASSNREVMRRMFSNSVYILKKTGFDGFVKIHETVTSYPAIPVVIACAIADSGADLITVGGSDAPGRVSEILKKLFRTRYLFLINKVRDFIPYILKVDDQSMDKVIGCLNHLQEAAGSRIGRDENFMADFTGRLFEIIFEAGGRGFDAVVCHCSYFMSMEPEIILRWLSKSLEVLRAGGGAGIEKFAARSYELTQKGSKTVEAFMKGESSEYLEFIEEITVGLKLKKVRNILKNYVHALLGYDAEIEAADTACTDGEKIFLPSRISDFSSDEENFVKYKVLASHEEAHLEYGSFDFELECAVETVESLKKKIRPGGGRRNSRP